MLSSPDTMLRTTDSEVFKRVRKFLGKDQVRFAGRAPDQNNSKHDYQVDIGVDMVFWIPLNIIECSTLIKEFQKIAKALGGLATPPIT